MRLEQASGYPTTPSLPEGLKMTFTDLEAQAAMTTLESTLRTVFTGNAIAVKEISDAVGILIRNGEYPMVNMWITLLSARNPDLFMMFGVFLVALTKKPEAATASKPQ
jgi:hypothetical protein